MPARSSWSPQVSAFDASSSSDSLACCWADGMSEKPSPASRWTSPPSWSAASRTLTRCGRTAAARTSATTPWTAFNPAVELPSRMTLPACVRPTAAACSAVIPVEVTATISSCPTRSSGVSRRTSAAQRPAASPAGVAPEDGVPLGVDAGPAGPPALADADADGPPAGDDDGAAGLAPVGAAALEVLGAGAAPRTPQEPSPTSSGPSTSAVSPGRRRRRTGIDDDM